MIKVNSENGGISVEFSGTGLDLITETSALLNKLYEHMRNNGVKSEKVNEIFTHMIFVAADEYENEVENGNIQT